jgi:hypothetical protein
MKFFKLDGKWVNVNQVVQFGKGKFGGWEMLLPMGTFLKVNMPEQALALEAFLSKGTVLDLDEIKAQKEAEVLV